MLEEVAAPFMPVEDGAASVDDSAVLVPPRRLAPFLSWVDQ
jgi:hypothetical protein